MTLKESITQLLDEMPEPRQRLLLDFARFLRTESEREDWQRFGMAHFAQGYADDDQEYSIEDLEKARQNADR